MRGCGEAGGGWEGLQAGEVERVGVLGFWFLLKMDFRACLMVNLGHVREEYRSPKISEDTSRETELP